MLTYKSVAVSSEGHRFSYRTPSKLKRTEALLSQNRSILSIEIGLSSGVFRLFRQADSTLYLALPIL